MAKTDTPFDWRALLSDSGMRARAIRTTGLVFLRFGASKFLRLASNVILTRLLFPEAFGLMALVTVVLGGVAMFSDLGIRGSIIQNERGEDPDFLNTAWTIQILRGFVLAAVILLGAGPLADFYGEPMLEDLLYLAALAPIFAGFASTRLATASRRLAIGRQTMLELGVQVVTILTMVFLAWWLQSVWALAIGAIIPNLITTVLSHIVLPGHPNRIYIERAALGQLFRFGRWIFLATIAGFFVNQGDKAVLGRFVDADMLGIYNIAFLLAILPAMIGHALNNAVLYPLYARRPPWKSEANRRKLHRARRLITPTLLGATFCLAMFGDWIVWFLYDERYAAAGPMLTLIALVAFPRIITQGYPNLPLAAGNSRRFAGLVVVTAIISLGLMILGAQQFGVAGVILVPPLAYVVTYPFLVWMIGPYKGWDPLHDAVYAVLALVAAGIIFTLRQDTLAPLLSAF